MQSLISFTDIEVSLNKNILHSTENFVNKVWTKNTYIPILSKAVKNFFVFLCLLPFHFLIVVIDAMFRCYLVYY